MSPFAGFDRQRGVFVSQSNGDLSSFIVRAVAMDSGCEEDWGNVQ